jgi:cell shape-determining protein MreC
LVEVELLEAAVLNRENGAIWRGDRILNRGAEDGLAETDLVLEGKRPVIDQGQEAHLATGHPVYSGRCVVGRLANVGRAVSTIQKVTDENYRGFAQLIRKTETGFLFGAEGVIEGQGQEQCLLRYVSGTLPVEVGDDVYTGDHDGSQPYPMYYGRVVRAELNPGDQEWTIWVQPAIQQLETPTVTVLRTQLDISRSLTN